MNKHFNTALIAAVFAASIFGGSAAIAQRACAPGLENVAGTCVTRGLAGSMTLRSVVMDQGNIGYNFPFAPKLDSSYPRDFDRNRPEFTQGSNNSTNPNPASP